VVAEPYSYLAVQVDSSAGEPVPWDGMLTRGVNTAGLAFTYAYVSPSDGPTFLAQTWTADMLATAPNIESAARTIDLNVGKILPGNYLFVDSSDAVLFEVTRDEVYRRVPRGGVLACTNAWEMSPDSAAVGWVDDTSATFRTERAWNLADKLSIRQALGDHMGNEFDSAKDRGSTLCNHGRTDGTISSEILEPSAGRLWFCHGWACGGRRGYEQSRLRPWGRYLPFSLENGIHTSAELVNTQGAVTADGVRLIDWAAMDEGLSQ